MPWMISKIDEALNGVYRAHLAASLEAITHLYRASGSEHGDIIEDFIARASVRPVALQPLGSKIVDGSSNRQLTFLSERRSGASTPAAK